MELRVDSRNWTVVTGWNDVKGSKKWLKGFALVKMKWTK